MAKKRTKTTPASIERRKKAGRGEGTGANYDPYHHVQDFYSRGRKTRAPRLTSKNPLHPHHVLSDLELTFLLIVQNSRWITDIREQWDLPLERTLIIAEQLALDHAVDPDTGQYKPVTVDFLITTDDGIEKRTWARTVKMSTELDDMRILEKFEIERVYMEGQGIDWGIVTEKQFPEQLRINVEDLRIYLTLEHQPLEEEEVWETIDFLTPLVYEGAEMQIIARHWEKEFGYPEGDGVTAIKFLIINNAWPVNLNQPLLPNKPIPLLDLAQNTPPPTENEGGEIS